MSLFTELKRRNVFKVAAAYIVTSWLVAQVAELAADSFGAPEWVMKMFITLLVLGLPFAIIFAWAFEMTPDGLKKEKDIDRSQSITQVTGQKLNNAIIGVLVVALGYFAIDKFVLDAKHHEELAQATQAASEQAVAANESIIEETADDKSIAVLPFINMSSDPEQEYFSDGITEEILNLLAKIPRLKVTSRSSVFSFKGQNVDIPTVAEKLGVAHVLEGSVRKSGNRIRITAQLIEAESDVHMWSETYDRELDDVFAIQDEIASEVVTVLQVQLLNEPLATKETNTEAYTAYLQGKHHMELASDIDAAAAQEALEKAIEIDPEYAPAWASLSRVLRYRANRGQVDLHGGTEQARQAAIKALQLDDTLAEAWASLARIQYVYDWNWNAAWGTSQTALMRGPNNAYALEAAAQIALAIGRREAAEEYYLKAVDVDPLNPVMMRNLASFYFRTENYDRAETVFKRILDLYPNYEFVQGWLSFTKLLQGKPEEARRLMDMESDEDTRILAGAFIFYDLGDMQKADEYLNYTIENNGDWLAYQIAELFAYRGDVEKTFEWLEITFEQRDGGVTHLLNDASLAPLHNDPRWEPYLLKLGLLDYWLELQKKRKEKQL